MIIKLPNGDVINTLSVSRVTNPIPCTWFKRMYVCTLNENATHDEIKIVFNDGGKIVLHVPRDTEKQLTAGEVVQSILQGMVSDQKDKCLIDCTRRSPLLPKRGDA